MLDLKHPRGKRFFGIAFPHRKRFLLDDRSCVHFRHDEMNGSAVPLDAGLQGAAMRVQPFELRQ